MTNRAVSEDVKEKLCENFKTALADKKDVSFENASEILKLLSSENIPGEVLRDAISWLDSLYKTQRTLIKNKDDQTSFLLEGVAFDNDADRGLYASDQLLQLINLKLKLINELSKLTELSVQQKKAVLDEQMAALHEKINVLDEKEAEFNAKRLPDFKGYEEDPYLILEYKSIGDALRSEKKLHVVNEMNSLAKEIYKNENNAYQIVPSFVVCCSSGTGKTQLPFCFDTEILYFVLVTHSQFIYEVYGYISNHLKNLIDIDFKNFCDGIAFKDKKKPENDPGYELIGYSPIAIKERMRSSYTLGFIFNLIKSVADLKSNPVNQTKSWIELELDKNISFPTSSMTISEAVEALKELVISKKVSRLPLIFLDEFNVGSHSSKKAKARYSFYHNIFRAVGLIPVVMGTDSNITNLVPTDNSASGKEMHTWGFVFYKLPPYPSELLKSKLKKLNIEDQKFLKFMEDVLVKERPLFVQPVLKCLKGLKKELNCMIADDFTFLFTDILYEIQDSFLVRKYCYLQNLIFGQFSLFENAPTIESDANFSYLPVTIHQYLGYLRCPNDIHSKYADKVYFELLSTGGALKYEASSEVIGTQIFNDYSASCSLPLTDQEPFTCLALSINFNSEHCAMQNRKKYFTSFQSFFQQEVNSIRKKFNTSGDSRGEFLESIVNTAYMISSHINGIDGLSFYNWFPFFIQQLGCYIHNDVGSEPISYESESECNLSAENLNGSTSEIFYGSVECLSKICRLERPEKINMKMCDKTLLNSHIAFAGFNGAMWDKNLKDYLLDRGYKLGSFIGSSHKSRYLHSMTLKKFNSELNQKDVNCTSVNHCDFELTEELSFEERAKAKQNTILVFECELNLKSISNSTIKEIVDKMISNNVYASIVIIVARQFDKNIDTDFKNITFYRLKRKSTKPIESRKCHVHQKGSSLKLELLSKNCTPTGEECNSARNLNCSNSMTKRKKTNIAKSTDQNNDSDQLRRSPNEPFSVILVEFTEIHGDNEHLKELLAVLEAE